MHSLVVNLAETQCQYLQSNAQMVEELINVITNEWQKKNSIMVDLFNFDTGSPIYCRSRGPQDQDNAMKSGKPYKSL